jgi:hydrogenase nickel incorporation protein HypA/HybF
MHELGIVFHIIDSVNEVCEENNLSKVSEVTLEVGEVSTVIGSYLKDCWRWAADKTELLKGSELIIDTVKAVTLCDDCGKTYSTVAHGKVCPYCASENTYLLSGREVSIRDIAAM